MDAVSVIEVKACNSKPDKESTGGLTGTGGCRFWSVFNDADGGSLWRWMLYHMANQIRSTLSALISHKIILQFPLLNLSAHFMAIKL